jgi:hypothetical protein
MAQLRLIDSKYINNGNMFIFNKDVITGQLFPDEDNKE